MKALAPLLFLFFSGFISIAQNAWHWANKAGGLQNDMLGYNGGNSLSIDQNNHLYITGMFSDDSIKFGNIKLSNTTPGTNAFIVKYNATGNVLWANSVSGQTVIGRSIAVDKQNNVYVAGDFESMAITIGPTILPFTGTPNSGNLFVAKLNSTGTLQWAISAGDSIGAIAIATDTSGNVYLTGSFYGNTTLGNISLTSIGTQDNFLAKLNGATGGVIWAKTIGNMSGIGVVNAAVDHQGNPVVIGAFSGSSLTIDGTLVPGNNNTPLNNDIFTAKFSPSGSLIWAVAAGGGGTEIPQAVASDSAGNIFVCGLYQDSFSFAGTTFITANAQQATSDGFVLKYNSSGVPQWGIPITGAGNDEVTDVFVDKDNNVMISGNFSSPMLSLSGNTILAKSPAFRDAFIIKLDNSGNLLWTDKTMGIVDYSEIVADTFGNVYLAGNSASNVYFGIFSISSPPANAYDVCIAKYGPCVSALPQPGNITGNTTVCSGSSQTYTIAPVAGANIYNWTLPPGWSGSSTSNSITVIPGNTGGVISVQAMNNCDTSLAQTIAITVNIPPTAVILEGNADTICQGSSFTISANTGTGYTYQWLHGSSPIPGATNSSHTVNQGGTYAVLVTSGNCSDTSAPIVITVNPSPAQPVITQAGLTLNTQAGQGSYQWYLNGTVIPGATNNTYTVTQNGNYTVVVTNSFNCSATSNTISITSLNIEELQKSSFAVYPQPANGFLSITTAFSLHNPEVVITNIHGVKIACEITKWENHRLGVKIANAASGVYFLSIKVANRVWREKILLE